MLCRRTLGAFFLSTLLVMMLVVFAVTGFLLWPRWLEYREQVWFEERALQLHAGVPFHSQELFRMFDELFSGWIADDTNLLVTFCGRRTWYAFFFDLRRGPGEIRDGSEIESVRVYRIDLPLPEDRTYVPYEVLDDLFNRISDEGIGSKARDLTLLHRDAL